MFSLLYTLFGWTELTTAFDLSDYDRILRTMDGGGIPYRTRALFDGDAPRSQSALGSVGHQPEHQTQYQILVKKGDLDRARFLLRTTRAQR